jgi:hypothetical protein
MLVDVIHDNHDAILEFVFGCNVDAEQDRQKKIVGKNTRAYYADPDALLARRDC